MIGHEQAESRHALQTIGDEWLGELFADEVGYESAAAGEREDRAAGSSKAVVTNQVGRAIAIEAAGSRGDDFVDIALGQLVRKK